MRSLRTADTFFAAALLALPLTGMGIVKLVSGHDLGTGIQPSYLFLLLAWAFRLLDLVRPANSLDRHRLLNDPVTRRWFIWLVLALGAVLVSGLGLVLAPTTLMPNEVWPRFFKQILQLGVMTAFLVYPAMWTRGPARWRFLVRMLAWATLGQVVYSAIQGVHGLWTLPGMAFLEEAVTSNPGILAGSEKLYLGSYTTLPRLRGTMSEPLYLGSFLVGMIPLLIHDGRRRLAAGAAIVLLLTWSRGAWLAAMGAGFCWWWMRRRAGLPVPTRRLLLAGALTLGLGLVVVMIVAGPSGVLWPWRRLLQTLDSSDWSNLTRYYSGQAAIRAFLLSPLVGVGWGQFPYHFYSLVDLRGLESQFTWPVVNNIPLLVLCETGLVGLGVLLGLVVTLGRQTWHSLKNQASAWCRGRLAAVTASCCGLAIQLLFFSQYNLPHLWVIPGLWIVALGAPKSGAQDEEVSS